MILFPTAAQDLVLSTYELLWSDCEKASSVLVGSQWVFTESVRESLSTLIQLGCIGGEMSVSLLADAIKDADFDFSESVSLI